MSSSGSPPTIRTTTGPRALVAHGIAVWDVLKSCRRAGSLDSAVEPDSMVSNDFGKLFDEASGYHARVFQRGGRGKNFNRFVRVAADVHYRRLPSTSPGPNHALRGQADRLARSHNRTSITVLQAIAALFSNQQNADSEGRMAAVVNCRACGAQPRAEARFCDAAVRGSRRPRPNTSR